jgi:hypothetical protein
MQEEIPSNECNQAIIQFDSVFSLIGVVTVMQSTLQMIKKSEVSIRQAANKYVPASC